jgi:ubiquinone/menaquinone biosynthesis C-methylase UbiE
MAVPSSPTALPGSATPPQEGFYLGRELAPTMTHEGAPWLIRAERDAEEQPDLMIRELRLSPGQVACDVGAGNGFHTLRMAKVVAPGGRVIAVDIQPEMLALLNRRAHDAQVENVQVVLGEPSDPHLPPSTCDMVLMVDVYHELSDPPAMLAKLARALTKTGRIALVEFREEDPDVPIKALHKMSKAQILKEMEHNGLRLDRSFDGLPWQHLLLFATR